METDKPTLCTPEFRVSYPNVFKPKMNDLSGKEEFSLQALFPKRADLSQLKAAAVNAIQKKWGDKKPNGLKSPFRDQGERKNEDGIIPEGYAEGAIFINLKSTRQPGVVDKKVQPIIDQEDFYAGCYAIASVSCYAYEARNKEGKVLARGVSFGLNNIQKTRDGDPFSGRRKAEEEFEAITGGDEDASTVSDPFAD
jgi:hypothetical protein